MIEYSNEDCMVGMARYPDKYFDLAIVDPPYGINMDGGKIGGNNITVAKDYIKKNWDGKAPDKAYFDEIIRVSKSQIIFGANHFIFADCELAWTSFRTAVRKFTFVWNGMLQGDMKNKENRIHPTQKPVALYKWLLKNYAKQGDKILYTHVGSASSLIACYDMGFDAVGFELDKDYYEQSKQRLEDFMAQIKIEDMFSGIPEQLQIEKEW